MEPSEVRNRVAIALGLKLGVSHEQARVVGDTVLRVITECGLITLLSSDLARVNHAVAEGLVENAALRSALALVRDRFFPADQPERDQDALWPIVNGALAPASEDAGK